MTISIDGEGETVREIIAEQVAQGDGRHPNVARVERQRKEILDVLGNMKGAFLTPEDGTSAISIETLKELLTDWRFGIQDSMHFDMDVDGYHSLAHVLHRAYKDAASGGKGHARHGTDHVAFEDQDSIGHVAPLFGVGYLLGQATKKSRESMRLPHDAAVKELLGAIVYIAGTIIHLEKKARDDIPF